MKQAFKPLGIAAAVAAASAGYVNVASAQMAVANNALGDLALVPYYTVNGEWITGIHIVNSSESSQVVKFRFRRALDSMDALDFNVVMSPKDVYAGVLTKDSSDNIAWSADDTTCTVPATTGGKLTMPSIFREGAETGYVEIIAMGQPTVEKDTIGEVATHSGATADPALTPKSCAMVRANFFADGVSGTREGVVSNAQTTMKDALNIDGSTATTWITTDYTDSENALKVSYFIRDNESGVEFGDNAVHIANFQTQPTMTNQQFGWLSGDLDGFDFPDVDGGSPADAPSRGRYNLLRANTVLGVSTVLNEWTANPANGAALDWVATLPGQYAQLHQPGYVAAAGLDSLSCVRPGTVNSLNPTTQAGDIINALAAWTTGDSPVLVECDYRDLPVTASITAYNREEFKGTNPDEDLVVSPAPPGSTPTLQLKKEVNVIGFGGNSVLGVVDTDISADLAQNFGWLTLGVTAASNNGLCDWNPAINTTNVTASAQSVPNILAQKTCSVGAATGSTPIIGFAAWERNVAANPDASYGRIVGHSFVPASI